MAKPTGNRFLKLAGMTASLTSKAIGNKIKSIGKDEEEKLAAQAALYADIGQQIARTLGEMKGAVMKVGQMLSQFKDILPPEIAEALTSLQREAPPMEFALIKQQVERELKVKLETVFPYFEEKPFASASIGQVHRAKLANGEAVVVKVQYPGVDAACQGDLKQIRLALKLAGLVKISKELQDELFKEFEDVLMEELDYTQEAHHLKIFAAFHEKLDTGLIIPQVYREYSSKRVLTLSEELGEHIDVAATWPLEIRQIIGRRLFKMIGDQMFFLQNFHCDPHPGNFAFRPNGDVVVYDFGGTKFLDNSVVQTFKDLISAVQVGDMSALEENLRKLKVRNQKGHISADFYRAWSETLMRPMNGEFDFSTSQVHHDVMHLLRKSLKHYEQFDPSPTTLMSNRTISGHYWNFVALKIKDDYRDLVDHYCKN